MKICSLLRPFGVHTYQLQTDVGPIVIYMLPTIQNLQCHIDNHSHNQLTAATRARRAMDELRQ